MVQEGHSVFVSEYQSPEDFVAVWEMGVKCAIRPDVTKQRVEKLFVHESQADKYKELKLF